MPTCHPFRYALFVIGAGVLFIAFLFISPILWYDFQTHHWESQIRRHQNPAELQSWAASLIATYSSSNYAKVIPGFVTNKPPSEIPVSGRFPRVLVQRDRLSESSYGPYHVTLAWGSGFLPMWGMDIGDTNFVCTHKNPKVWVPGMYFFLEP